MCRWDVWIQCKKVFNWTCMQQIVLAFFPLTDGLWIDAGSDYVCQDGGLFAEHRRVRLGIATQDRQLQYCVDCHFLLCDLKWSFSELKKTKTQVSAYCMSGTHPAVLPIKAVSTSDRALPLPAKMLVTLTHPLNEGPW